MRDRCGILRIISARFLPKRSLRLFLRLFFDRIFILRVRRRRVKGLSWVGYQELASAIPDLVEDFFRSLPPLPSEIMRGRLGKMVCFRQRQVVYGRHPLAPRGVHVLVDLDLILFGPQLAGEPGRLVVRCRLHLPVVVEVADLLEPRAVQAAAVVEPVLPAVRVRVVRLLLPSVPALLRHGLAAAVRLVQDGVELLVAFLVLPAEHGNAVVASATVKNRVPGRLRGGKRVRLR